MDQTRLKKMTKGFAQFAAMGGTTLSLDISYVVDITEIPDSGDREAAETAYRTKLRRYIAAAEKRGLRVEALAGSPHWIGPEVRYVTAILAEFVTSFNQESPRDLTGWHYDLEPWGTPAWSSQKRALTRQLLDTVDQITKEQAAVPDDERVPVTVDLPFWLDGTSGPKSVRYDGVKLSPTEHVMRILDNDAGVTNAVAIMAYRDSAQGSDGSLALTSAEFAMADAYDGRVAVVVGLEIGNGPPDHVTFAEEGLGALRSSMRALVSARSDDVAWGGLAIDDFASLSAKFTRS